MSARSFLASRIPCPARLQLRSPRESPRFSSSFAKSRSSRERKDNIARLLVETVDDDLTTVLARVEPELTRLMSSGLVARIGEEYEFLTGERRTFEEEVTTIEQQYMLQDRERGLKDNFVQEPGKNHWRRGWTRMSSPTASRSFTSSLSSTDCISGSKGDVTLRLYSPR